MSSFRQGKGPEKSNFARTCNLLSQYVKEKGNIRDLNLEIGGKAENLDALMKPESSHAATNSPTMNLLTKMEKSALPLPEQRKEAVVAEAKPSPLTIFYSGRVLVFKDYPAEKAQELLSFAKSVSPQVPLGDSSTALPEKVNVPPVSTPVMTNSRPVEQVPRPQQPEAASDLPIARRSSLHRFLAKRKDRAATRGPYQVPVNEQPGSSSSKVDEQLELKL